MLGARPGSSRRSRQEEGADRIRTGVRGFAGLCLTSRPPRQKDVHASAARVGIQRGTAALREQYSSLKALQEEAATCTRCDLYKNATQTVFGEARPTPRSCSSANSPATKDLAGKPFVGPAGRLLDQALGGSRYRRCSRLRHQRGQALQVATAREATDPPEAERRRDRRLPAVAGRRALAAEAELSLPPARPRAGAARPSVPGQQDRGIPVESDLAPVVMATVHPSSILRSDDREAEMALFVEDLAGPPRPFEPPDRDRDQEAEQDQGRPGDAQPRGEHFRRLPRRPVALVDLLRQKSRHSTASP